MYYAKQSTVILYHIYSNSQTNVMKIKLTMAIFGLVTCLRLSAQTATSITGFVKDNNNIPLQSVTVSLLKAADSSLVKADITGKDGAFQIMLGSGGHFLLSYSIIGFENKYSLVFTIDSGKNFTAPVIMLQPSSHKLQNVTVTAHKPMIEIKADKLVFNVESSINATGSNSLELLQKSPGVQVDNNDNISMKGKSGVKIYIDGKMAQLDTKSLADYLRSINSSDIESIEMISNPGAKYDASGNAGIINIKLKKNKKFGTNGDASIGYTQGITPKGNGSVSLNYRDKKINVFSNLSGSIGNYQNDLDIYRIQSDSIYNQHTTMVNQRKNANIKAGVDYFIDSKNTIGFLVNSNFSHDIFSSDGNTAISYQPTNQFVKTLNATNYIPGNSTNANFNVNYRYEDTSGKTIGFDGDYGLFRSTGNSYQPNYYTDADNNLLYSIITGNSTPTDINIYTAKLDLEQKLWKGTFGYGAKFSYVKTSNVFDFYNYTNNIPVKDLTQSNSFVYTENVNAAYVSYNRTFTKKWSLQSGLRMEQTNSEGDLTNADGITQPDDTVKRSYLDLFPSAAISYNLNDKNTFGLTYSRRIDRPNYQDLNPFENKLDQLTYQKGNAFLRPQYTDNIELSHTFDSKLITTIGYSHVKDYATQVTDTTNGNATYVQQQNIATQKILSINIGSPLTIKKWWNGYANIWYNYQFVKGAYNNIVVNIQAPSYGAYMQNSFTLGKDYTAEVSGWVNGPGLDGTWQAKALGGVDMGIQKLLFKKKATIKLSATDVLHTVTYYGSSNYGGTSLNIRDRYENQTIRLNFSYRFGSSQIKAARQHKTGLESESNRIKN
jgi:iron complex outermembrane receptor protein